MNTKAIAVAVLVTSLGTLVLTQKDRSSASVAMVQNQQPPAPKTAANECGNAADVWLCMATKKSQEHQKAWDAAHPAAARKKEADDFSEQFSWVDRMGKK